jgi:hypothetical protein
LPAAEAFSASGSAACCPSCFVCWLRLQLLLLLVLPLLHLEML